MIFIKKRKRGLKGMIFFEIHLILNQILSEN